MGRSQETFVDSAERRRGLGCYLFGIHGQFWDQMRDLRILQDRAGTLNTRIVTRPRAYRAQIQETLEQWMPMVWLQFEYVAVTERHPNGKRRYFASSMLGG